MVMERCPLFYVCESPSKRENSWACINCHEEKLKMCVAYIIAYKLGWVELKETPAEEISIPQAIKSR